VQAFSKTLSASLRSGYIAGPQSLIASLTDMKMLSVVNSSGYVEQVIHDLIARGHYGRHLRRLQNRVAQATASTMAQLARLGLPASGRRAAAIMSGARCQVPTTWSCHAGQQRRAFSSPRARSSAWTRSAIPAMRVNIAYADHPKFLGFLSR
jgi:aspartate/methionine/tyrosine aminotransferase